MRVKTFFLFALAVPTIASLAFGLWIVTDLARAYDGNERSHQNAEALRAVAEAVEVFAVQRGNLNMAMLAEAPAPEALRANMDKDEAATKAAMDRALNLMGAVRAEGGAGMAAQVTDIDARIKKLQIAVAEAIKRQKSDRDPVLMKSYAGTMADIIATATPVMDGLERQISQDSNDVGEMIAIARLGMNYRTLAGSRSITVVSALLSGQPAAPATLISISELQGGMNETWKRIAFLVDQVGKPGALTQAMAIVDEKFIKKTTELYAPVMAAARTDGKYGLDIPTFRKENVASLAEINKVRDAAFVVAITRAEEGLRKTRNNLVLTGAILLATLGICLVVGVWFGRRVVDPLISLTGTLNRLAEGQHDQAIFYRDRNDEVGVLAGAVEILRNNAIAAAKLAAENDNQHRAKEAQARRLEELCAAFDSQSATLIGAMGTAARDAMEQSKATEQMSREVLGHAAKASDSSNAASANVQTVAAATEELSSSIGEISNRVGRAAMVSSQAVSEAHEANQRIGGLAQAASRIGEVVNLISTIASQTNLLALNATIEAARAGEAGKGFAVVAGEVKNLANQTAKATEEIGNQVGSIQLMTKDAVRCIDDVGQTIRTMNEIATAIAAAVEEQGAATSEIARNIQLAASGTHEAASAVNAVARSMGEAEEKAELLGSAMDSLQMRASKLTEGISVFLRDVRT